jgi:cyclophilin family peptidyl-prolyl cis-trans isomerase
MGCVGKGRVVSLASLSFLEVRMLRLRRAVAGAGLVAMFAAGSAAAQSGQPAAPKNVKRDPSNPVVLMSTSMGDIKIELYKKDAPKTVDNFIAYVRKKHYDGTIFHRVMGNFMIQGGGYDKDLVEKPTMPPVVNEAKLSNGIGTIAMARTDDPNSATAQFYINVKNNKQLDRTPGDAGYAVFGKVIDGMDVVDQIKAVKTKQQPPEFEALPLVPVVIKSVTLVR